MLILFCLSSDSLRKDQAIHKKHVFRSLRAWFSCNDKTEKLGLIVRPKLVKIDGVIYCVAKDSV
jgi:hypothetical protein